jgi:histidyl-tRNA synthetase
MATFQTLPGFRDFAPDDFARRAHVFRIWRQTAATFGFAEYDGPVLESLDLYKAKSGDEIEGQLFSFTDKGGREVALRPEMTPSVCRMIGAHAASLKRPIKWFSVGEFYRYERMQKGRGRCFSQLNADLFGESGPEAEIELIALLVQTFRAFGLTEEDFYVRLSDRTVWIHFLEALGLDGPRSQAVLGAVDKWERHGEDAFKPYAEQFGPLDKGIRARIMDFLAIRSIDGLASAVGALSHAALSERLLDWRRVLDGLAAMGLGDYVRVDLGVVRGLAYYTGFVFEAFDAKGDLRALAGGGRFDDLVEKLGGPSLPAVGFGMGDMTLSLLLEQRGLLPAIARTPDVYCVIGGPAERAVAFGDIQALRASGFRVEYPLRELAFGKQFKAAAESGARIALIYGSEEVAKGIVKIRDLGERSEKDIPRDALQETVRSLISGH